MAPTKTHYCGSQDIVFLKRWADQRARALMVKIKRDRPITLFYRGMSGSTLATALALALYDLNGKQPNMIYVRKKNEDSHGEKIEHRFMSRKKSQLVFVDDFISSGKTFKECYKAILMANLHEYSWKHKLPNVKFFKEVLICLEQAGVEEIESSNSYDREDVVYEIRQEVRKTDEYKEYYARKRVRAQQDREYRRAVAEGSENSYWLRTEPLPV